MIEVKWLGDDGGTHSGPIAMARTHEDDWCCVATGSESRGEPDAIQSRHFDVTHNDIRRPALDFLPCLLAVMGTVDRVSRFRKKFVENLTQMAVVIDDED